jgi:FkbM family methyltransferase
MSFNFLDKIKFLVKTESFQQRPVKTLYRCVILLFLSIFKITTKYKVNIKFSKFIYTFKPYEKSGLGGRGQYILRDLYEPFLNFGHNIFNKKFYFIDIGCSRGFFSMYLLNLKNLKAEGLCIDPLSKSLEDFKEILKLNKIKRAKLLNALISDQKNKKRNIYRVSDYYGYYSIIKNVNYADKKIKEKLKINSYTLDQLVFEKYKFKKLDFIKIDTEGAEYEILKKSKKTLQKFKPAIYCEITRKTNKIINLLKIYGYEFFAISNEEKHKLKKNFYANVLALHKNSSLKKI